MKEEELIRSVNKDPVNPVDDSIGGRTSDSNTENSGKGEDVKGALTTESTQSGTKKPRKGVRIQLDFFSRDERALATA